MGERLRKRAWSQGVVKKGKTPRRERYLDRPWAVLRWVGGICEEVASKEGLEEEQDEVKNEDDDDDDAADCELYDGAEDSCRH